MAAITLILTARDAASLRQSARGLFHVKRDALAHARPADDERHREELESLERLLRALDHADDHVVLTGPSPLLCELLRDATVEGAERLLDRLLALGDPTADLVPARVEAEGILRLLGLLGQAAGAPDAR
jgi:hypothetical protein